MVAILLLSMLSCTIGRPISTFNDVTPVAVHDTAAEEVTKANDVENCTGSGEEECLMRRTLAAHLDYIYTNKSNPGNL
ncbi:hypothetical protein E3N88_06239 [Mikania micrantha]|uniref:Phytosulfokine n=1 Tax=Mikania micrantha TaxID=192012 RepID=A0A5N6PN85_9ASTR|nr:hypothetical protein E3N88_06239 [Mikania micrantha]